MAQDKALEFISCSKTQKISFWICIITWTIEPGLIFVCWFLIWLSFQRLLERLQDIAIINWPIVFSLYQGGVYAPMSFISCFYISFNIVNFGLSLEIIPTVIPTVYAVGDKSKFFRPWEDYVRENPPKPGEEKRIDYLAKKENTRRGQNLRRIYGMMSNGVSLLGLRIKLGNWFLTSLQRKL